MLKNFVHRAIVHCKKFSVSIKKITRQVLFQRYIVNIHFIVMGYRAPTFMQIISLLMAKQRLSEMILFH